jgi:hypothetical protein
MRKFEMADKNTIIFSKDGCECWYSLTAFVAARKSGRARWEAFRAALLGVNGI